MPCHSGRSTESNAVPASEAPTGFFAALRMTIHRFIRLSCFGLCTVLAVASLRADQATDIALIHLSAIGGRERISALTGLRMSGYVTMTGKRVRFSMIAARPNRVRLETGDNGRSLVNASDGVEPAWEFDTGTWPPRYRPMSDAAAKAFTADAEFDDPLVAGPARGFQLEYAGEAEVDGRKLLRVLVTRNLADTFSLLLDAAIGHERDAMRQQHALDRAEVVVARHDLPLPPAGRRAFLDAQHDKIRLLVEQQAEGVGEVPGHEDAQ